MADDRTYIRVHDGMDEHPKIEGLSDAAFRTLHRCWYLSSRQLTDGKLTDAAWKNRAKTPRVRRELVDARLVHLPGFDCPHPDCPPAEPGHVQMHDYLDHQRSAAEVDELKAARGAGGSYGNHVKWHVKRRKPNPDCQHCTDRSSIANASQDRSQTDRSPIANPSHSQRQIQIPTEVEGGRYVSNATDSGEPPRCSNHQGWRREDIPDCWACGHKREQWQTTRTADDTFQRPPWCGHCDQFTRLTETDTGMARCPACHPLAHQETA